MARTAKLERLSVAIEVTRSRLHLAILERRGADGQLRVPRGRSCGGKTASRCTASWASAR